MGRLAIAAFAVFGSAGSGGVAAAQERAWPSAPYRGSPVVQPPCTCRSPVGEVDLGGEVCLRTPAGPRKARCVMVLNNTSWALSEMPVPHRVEPHPVGEGLTRRGAPE